MKSVAPIAAVVLLPCAALAAAQGAAQKDRPGAAQRGAAAVPESPPAAPRKTEPLTKPGEAAVLFSGLVHNPETVGAPTYDLSSVVGADATDPDSKAVVLSFFATWCKPCLKELPFLQALYTEYKDKGLRVVSVAIDKDEPAWAQIRALVQQHGVQFPVVKDRLNLIVRQYLGLQTELPAVFIIDRDGLVRIVKQGYPEDAETFLRAEVEKALAHSAPAQPAEEQ